MEEVKIKIWDLLEHWKVIGALKCNNFTIKQMIEKELPNYRIEDVFYFSNFSTEKGFLSAPFQGAGFTKRLYDPESSLNMVEFRGELELILNGDDELELEHLRITETIYK